MNERRSELVEQVGEKLVAVYSIGANLEKVELTETAMNIIALVTAARDAEIRQALLEAADGYIVAKGQDGEAEGAFATKPWMMKILDAIGLAEEGAER